MFQIIISIRNQSRISHRISETFLHKSQILTFLLEFLNSKHNKLEKIKSKKLLTLKKVTKNFLLILKLNQDTELCNFCRTILAKK